MRKDEVRDIREPGCIRDIGAGLGILGALGLVMWALYRGVTTWS